MTRTLLDTILDPAAITVVFQPTFEWIGPEAQFPRVHFIECLSRGPRGTTMESAGVLFEYARRKGKEAVLDRICLELALRTVAGWPERPLISLNVHASTLERDPDFAGFLDGLARQSGVPLTEIILEIVEHAPDWSSPEFLRILASLKDAGVRIALDDIGLGQSNYRMILDCRPDYFKLDRYLVSGCAADPNRKAVMESLVLLANRMGGRVVAEGIETAEDLATVRSLGIHLVQGYLLARPSTLEGIQHANAQPEKEMEK